ncbi:hypothetical protein HMPREF0620_0374 [Parascardovia denticolens DSM 10105 = JCM 12538]|uniref:Uncharacterized protein n=1 Tax=Parascardovia denticolens DSM 10105 = JCM 12538 TaxID=864564 RepID=E6K0N1_PARDN|nr:hypothetical protein HMPREF0620_0374 [Parascardovia denticolens DSM 10105 = JCM 12538]
MAEVNKKPVFSLSSPGFPPCLPAFFAVREKMARASAVSLGEDFPSISVLFQEFGTCYKRHL